MVNNFFSTDGQMYIGYRYKIYAGGLTAKKSANVFSFESSLLYTYVGMYLIVTLIFIVFKGNLTRQDLVMFY